MADSQGNSNQLSNLPPLKRLITSHNTDSKAVVHSAKDFSWQRYDNDQMAFSVVYATTQFPANLNEDTDIKAYDDLVQKGIGLVNPGGTVIRCVDFAPGYRCGMHRTQSLDYGIVLEGNIDMVLDSGDVEHMKRGDVAVQRATQHQWLNTSSTEWARDGVCVAGLSAAEGWGSGVEGGFGEEFGVSSA